MEEQKTIRVNASVLGPSRPGFLMLILGHGQGLADGGFPTEFPVAAIPPEYRMPNSQFMITMEPRGGEVIKVEPLAPEDEV